MIISIINHTNGQLTDEQVQAGIRAINRQMKLTFSLVTLVAALMATVPALSQPTQPLPAGQVQQTIQQQMITQQPLLLQRLIISVRTDKGIYRSGERPRISGRMLFGVGNPATGFARVKVYEKDEADTGEAVRYNNIVEVRNGEFADDSFIIQIPRKTVLGLSAVFQLMSADQIRYRAEVTGITETPSPPTAFTEFMAEDVGVGRMLYIIALSAAGLIYVLVMVYYAFMRTPTKRVATRMLLMTYMITLVFLVLPFLGPLLIFASPDLEALLRTTPVGFLKAPMGRPEEVQWVINIGGALTTGGALKGGIAVPLLVLVLSLLGAAINMLRRLPDFLKKYNEIPEQESAESGEEYVAGEELRTELFKYFVYILSAPFIAMVAFSLMVIADYTNPHALSIVAFSVGFISDTVVEIIMGRARSMFSGKGGSEQGGK